MDRWHKFQGYDGVEIIYDTETMLFFSAPPDLDEAVIARQIDAITKKNGKPSQQPLTFVTPNRAPEIRFSAKPELERLVFIVTTNCNLKCTYCYADGGSYGMPTLDMSEDIARRAVEWVYDQFSVVHTIQFFGGEPTLNPQIVDYVCNTIETYVEEHDIPFPPRYGLVTNGTHMTPQMEDVIRRHHIGVTFSIDGPEIVHNIHRINKGGRGTYSETVKAFRRLREYGDVFLGVEMTLTPQALDKGYGVWELLEFADQALGLQEAHIVPVSAEPGSSLSWDEEHGEKLVESFREATHRCLASIAYEGKYRGFSLLTEILRSLILKQPRELICPAGSHTIAVDPWGFLYPCFMFAGEASMRMGNVLRFRPERFNQSLNEFMHFNYKSNHPSCTSCWAYKLCKGCMGNVWTTQKRLDSEWGLMCRVIKAVSEEIMRFLADLQRQPTHWTHFVHAYKQLRLAA